MRLFIISLLALSAHAHSVAYRTNLLSYAPSRGEFAVDHGRAQGYVRYFDASGAERLLPYYYPEPLYGLRRLSYGGGDAVHPLLRTGLKSEPSQEENELFRAWCEQRYNALKSEIERLRAAGKAPSAHMMSQFEPLEKLIKAGAYESGIASGLSPDVLRAREEHYRIWNEARLNVLQAEEQQMRLHGAQYLENKPQEDILLKQFDLKSRIDIDQAKPAQQQQQQLLLNQAQYQQSALKAGQVQLKEYSAQAEYTPGQAPQPVQDTPEVQRAREEHLKLLKQAQQNALIGQTEQYQKPAQSQPAIKYTQVALPTTIEKQTAIGGESQTQTQTKQYESQSESKYMPGQLPQPVQETPEVLRAREEHLRLIEQAKKNLQSASQYNSYTEGGAYKQLAQKQADTKSSIQPIAAIKTTNYETASLQQQDQQQQQQQQSLQETPEVLRAREEHLRLVDEVKLRIEDRFADEADLIKLEERERDNERLRELEMRKEEEKQLELERQREAERQKEEQRLMSAELIALQEEEQRRMDKERNEEAERLKKEEIEQFKFKTNEYQTKYIAQPHLLLQQPQQPIQQAQQQQQQLQQNGFFLRIQANQPNALLQQVPAGGAYIIAGQQTAGAQYYIPTTHENPFLLRYTQDAQPIKQELTALSLADSSIIGDYKKNAIDKQISQAQPQQLKATDGNFASSKYSSGAAASSSSSLSSSSSSSLSSSSATSSFASSSDAASAGISELDKATRDHFRAHEIALEQLRLANLKTPCN